MKIISVLLMVAMLSGCATIRRHPVVTGIVVGAGVGIGVGLATRQHSCPYSYEGHPYGSGTTCPWKPVDPSPDHRK
jgi:hypothetical protein